MKKLFNILLTLLMLYTVTGIPHSFANRLSPAINEVKLPQGQRSISSVNFSNEEDKDVEILLTVYEYNPQTEEMTKDGENIFLKVDTDTFTVKANSEQEIQYEIYPPSNLELGTYFNILVLTEVIDSTNVYINKGISQLVILHITDADQSVKGIATDSYTAKIDIVTKGIPFILPTKIKYTITNDSNYVLTPTGRIEIFNKRSDYKPEYIYINKDNKKLYPTNSIEEIYEIDNWNISDIFSERVAIGNFYNGLDTNPKRIETQINSYVYETLGGLIVLVVTFLLIRSIKEDRKNSKKAS
jgi:hypothetical protein